MHLALDQLPARPRALSEETFSKTSAQRISALDGLRGLSIALVVLYHAYSRWADRLPWASALRHFVVFEQGTLGVNLFFLISGFVILLTLEKCRSFGEFLYRRWLRLFPAMLLATVLIYVTSGWLPERPVGQLSLVNTLPGLCFIDPFLLETLFGIDTRAVDSAFWSIFVEVKFYLIFGLLYFVTKKRALPILLVLFLVSFVVTLTASSTPSSAAAQFLNMALNRVLALRHFGWFVIGALVFKAYSHRDKKALALSICLLPLAILANSEWTIDAFIVSVALYMVFISALFSIRVAALFASPMFVFGGFISYPLYLIHQNASVALTIKLHHYAPGIPGMLTPLPPMLAVTALAFLIAKYGEPVIRRLLLALARVSLLKQ
jgi:peptidoglycan/LPS O-acetylase OafA/YrhL